MATHLLHNRRKSRFDIRVEDKLAGSAHYKLSNGVATFDHTVIKPAFEGQGLGSQVVRFALDQAKAEGWRIGATCPFVVAYLERHPELG